MIDILKRILVGIIVGMSIFFLKTQVFALSWDLDYQTNFTFNDSVTTTGIQFLTSDSATFKNVNIDFAHEFTSSSSADVFAIPITFQSYVITTDSSNNKLNYSLSESQVTAYLYSRTADVVSTCEIQNNFIVCPVLPNHTYYRLQLRMVKPFFLTGSSYYSQFNFVFNLPIAARLYKTSFSSVSSAVEQQTDEIMNTDEPASATYDNDYSTSDYDSAEQSIHSTIDVDVSSLTFDANTWGGPFHYIWDLVTSFVQVNSKVFSMITGFLTFSFVGLVFNRS